MEFTNPFQFIFRSKPRILGEVIMFLLRTSLHFAVRESKEPRPTDIMAVWVQGLPTMFSGRFDRCPFDTNGMPTFQKVGDRWSMYVFLDIPIYPCSILSQNVGVSFVTENADVVVLPLLAKPSLTLGLR
jgi:hypothetical protein